MRRRSRRSRRIGAGAGRGFFSPQRRRGAEKRERDRKDECRRSRFGAISASRSGSGIDCAPPSWRAAGVIRPVTSGRLYAWRFSGAERQVPAWHSALDTMLYDRARLTGGMTAPARQVGVAIRDALPCFAWRRHVERACYFAAVFRLAAHEIETRFAILRRAIMPAGSVSGFRREAFR